MDRHFQCECGGTGWIDREDEQVTIRCSKCGTTVQGSTLTECRGEWRARQKKLADDQKERKRGTIDR